MTGNLLGASVSGADRRFLGWRGVLAVLGVLVDRGLGRGGHGLSRRGADPAAEDQLRRSGTATVRSSPIPNAFCYAAVFIEGCCVLGLFPYHRGVPVRTRRNRLSIAGLVIAGFAVGGLFYTLTVSRFLPRLGVKGMMIAGRRWSACSSSSSRRARMEDAALSLIFMGWGFYMIHGCLQVFASELSVEARATALSLHSFFFFMGQTIGPIAYGFGILHAGKIPTLLVAAAVMIALGFVCARLLRQTRPADQATS